MKILQLLPRENYLLQINKIEANCMLKALHSRFYAQTFNSHEDNALNERLLVSFRTIFER